MTPPLGTFGQSMVNKPSARRGWRPAECEGTGQDSVRYIRSTSWVVKPIRSYTVTAATLSAST